MAKKDYTEVKDASAQDVAGKPQGVWDSLTGKKPPVRASM